MKRCIIALGVCFACVGLCAEEASLKPQVVAHDAVPKGSEAVVVTLDADEQAFVAELSDQNRRAFSERLNADQREAVLVAVDNGADPDEAVHRMVTSLEIKEKSLIVQAD